MFRGHRILLLAVLSLTLALAGLSACDDEGVRADAQPQINVDPPSGEFGQVTVGDSESQTFYIANHGNADLLLSGVFISPEDSTAFSITREPDTTAVAPGSDTTVEVTFRPQAPGSYSAKLVIECNDLSVDGRVEVPLNTRRVEGSIYAQPPLIDFGSVEPGASRLRYSDVVNSGAAAFQIRTVQLVAERQPNDFAIVSLGLCGERLTDEQAEELVDGLDDGCTEATGVITLEPSKRLRIKVVYTPQGGDSDQGVIRLDTTLSRAPTFEIGLVGTEPAPRIALLPAELDFGPTPLDGATETVTLRNVGTGLLRVEEMTMAVGSGDAYAFEAFEMPTTVAGEVTMCGRCTCSCLTAGDETAEPEELSEEGVAQLDCLRVDCAARCGEEEGRQEAEAGAPPVCADPEVRHDDRTITVTYAPSCEHTSVNPARSRIFIRSNDPTAPAGGTQLALTGRLDAPGVDARPAELDFQVVPSGESRALSFRVYNIGSQPLNLASLAVTDNPEEFEIVAPQPTEDIVVGPGDNIEIQVRYAPVAEHVSRGVLTVEHDSPCQEPVEVALAGRGGGAPYCRILVTPRALNYGTVAAGRTVEKTVEVRSIGTGACRFDGARITAGLEGLPPPEAFRVQRTPGQEIPAWETGEVVVAYVPSRNLFDQHNGVVVIDTSDPDGSNPVTHRVQLHGRTGTSEIQVLPHELDFGLTTLGCASQTMAVTVYNVGAVNLTIDRVFIDPQAAIEFEILSDVRTPYVVSRAAPLQVEVRYVPQDQGPDNADLVFQTDAANANEFRVPLRGEGTLEDQVVDEFIQAEGQQVDVLFVVDNSGSMGDDQENLARNFGSFVQGGDLLSPDNNVDFHIGVITTELGGSENPFAPDGEMGPDRGKLHGETRMVTPDTPNFQATFEDNVLVGDDESGAQESGLETARAALSPTWLNDVPYGNCGGADDCGEGEECVGGQCVGYNRGFLREMAALEIVFVSDEEDQSPAQVDFYIDYFKSIKGFRNEGLLRCWAIVGDAPNGCQTNDGAADAGRRYIDVADNTGGRFHSICDREFSQAMEDIGHTAFSLRVQFFLSRVAELGTIVVEVEGRPVPEQDGNGLANWEYDPDSNSIIFLSEAAIPQPGDQITISYRARCFVIE